MQKSVSEKILTWVRSQGRGTVFTPSDVLRYGSRAAIDQALSRLVKRGEIRRISRGLYNYPQVSERLGVLSPDPDAIAKALAGETGSRVQAAGARAANLLGLSEQVAARAVYVTDGPARRVKAGRQVVELRPASPRNLIAVGEAAGLVIQALRYLGRDNVDEGVVQHLHDVLSTEDKRELARVSHMAPTWMRPFLEAISHERSNGSDRTAPSRRAG